LTVSPKRQYRGIVNPTTPAQQGPVEKTLVIESTKLHYISSVNFPTGLQ